jgi:phospholipid/cholesterol/gamma-HCH transport system substrate-binding protein
MTTTQSKVRRHRPRVSSAQAGAFAVIVVLVVCYLVFGGSVPFTKSPFVLRAVFTSNTDLHIPSPVRIAGVDVGEVTGVQRIKGSRVAGIVTMDIDQSGLPIHSDATAQIRSRIFLEGNFYVDLHPGTPEAPTLRSGATLPAANTSGPVQLDRVLSSLTADARSNLQRLVRGLGGALNGPPTAADEAGQDPAVKGLTGAQGLNYSLNYSAGAFEASAIVNQALLGLKPHDLSGVIKGESKVFDGLAASGDQLSGLVVSFDRTVAALANQQAALSATVAVLPALLRATNSADDALDASFGPTQQFAAEIIPGINQIAPTIEVAIPWLNQLAALNSQSELGGLVSNLQPAVENTAAALKASEQLLPESNELAECFTKVVIPTGNQKITVDPSDDVGLQDYQELFQSAVGIGSASQDFDGNGRYERAAVGGGTNLIKTPSTLLGPLYGNSVFPQSGMRTLPEFPGKGKAAPVLNASSPCFRQTVPNLNSAKIGVGP